MDSRISSEIRDCFDRIQKRSLSLRTSHASQRKEKLKKMEAWMLDNRSRIQKALYADIQKPPEEADLTEIYVVLSEVRKARKNLRIWMAEKSVPTALTYLGTKASVHYEPKGACLIIAPWNYPFQLAVAPLVSAIAAGNGVILKPSEYAEHTSQLIKEMCAELFDEAEVAVWPGGVEVSSELLSLPFDHLFFTGSPRVGKIVMAAAAKHLASITLELGGKSPTIVDASADIQDAAEKIAWGKWLNAGQVCIAPDHLYVHEEVIGKFIDALSVASENLYGSKANYGAIISRTHHNRINELMADAIEKGAELAFGGKSKRENLRFSPTALTNVSEEMKVMQEEIFGPILPIVPYRDLDQMVKLINSQPKPLAIYVFAKNKQVISQVKQRTSSGMLTVNDCVLQFAHPNLPIGGVNNSGIGKAHGHAGFLAFSNEKATLKQRRGLTMTKTVYPPYSKLKKFMINLMVKYF